MRRYQKDKDCHYITQTCVSEDALLEKMRAKGEEMHLSMQISPLEGKMLYIFAKMIRAKRILEIGTFIGYSTLWLARALPEDGNLITLEYEDEHADIAEAHFTESEVGNRITVKRGKALDSLNSMQNEKPFDLVFIDAMKREYPEYLEKVTPIVRQGGIIIGDNTLLFGALTGEPQIEVRPAAMKAMQEFNETLSDSGNYEGIMLSTAEGMMVAIKK